MTTVITLHISSIKGFPNDLLKKNRGANLSFVTDIGGRLQECGRTALQDDGTIFIRDGVMTWTIDSSLIQNLKASQPKIKVHININKKSAATTTTSSSSAIGFAQSVGFCLLDIRDIGKDKKAVWLKVHGDGFKNTEIQMKSKIIEQLPSTSTTVDDLNTNINKNTSKMNYDTKSRVTTTSSSTSTPSGQVETLIYQLHMSILEFRDIYTICRDYISSSQLGLGDAVVIEETLQSCKYMFCWKLFGQTFYSNDFSLSSSSSLSQQRHEQQQPIQDIFQVQCPSNKIINKLSAEFPIKMQLCLRLSVPNPDVTENNTHTTSNNTHIHIIGIAELDYPSILSHATTNASTTATTTDNIDFPLTWFDIKSTSTSTSSNCNSSIRAGLKLQPVLPPPTTNNTTITTNTNKNTTNTIGEDDEYYDDEFDEEEVSPPVVTAAANNNNNQRQSSQSQSQLKPPTPSATPDPIINIASKSTNNNNKIYDKILSGPLTTTKLITPSSSSSSLVMPTKVIDTMTEEYHYLRHYRVSIDVKTISHLKRPANILISYAYPYLGATQVVRTHPLWVLPHTEGKIDGGSATFDCCMSKHQICSIFQKHIFKILVSSRSQLGTTVLGDVSIDLKTLEDSSPVSYRCIVTGKSFKTIEDYNKHRVVLMKLAQAGKVDTIPPVLPISINAYDHYYNMTPATTTSTNNNKIDQSMDEITLRVVSIIEDLGQVGSKVSVGVRQGYTQQGGAVYTSIDGLDPNNEAVRAIHQYNQSQLQHLVAAADTEPVTTDPVDNIISKPVLLNYSIDPSTTNNNNGEEENVATTTSSSTNLLNINKLLDRKDLSLTEKIRLQDLTQQFEEWRQMMELKWRSAMKDKETQIRQYLEQENQKKLQLAIQQMKVYNDKIIHLELQLKEKIQQVEATRNGLLTKEDEFNIKIAQKTSELQLLQKRIKDESKLKIDIEMKRNEALEQQITSLKNDVSALERRCKDTEYDFDSYRKRQRNTPETMLREENAKLKAQLGNNLE